MIFFCQFGILWSHQAMLENHVMVEVLVELLADVAVDEGADEVIRELASVLSIYMDRNVLTREMWSFLKKMLKVGVKKTILSKITNRVDSKNKHFKKQEVKKPSTGRPFGNDHPVCLKHLTLL